MRTYLITFACYGHHLPGQQGTVDKNHNVPGTRLPNPAPKLRQYVDGRLKQEPFEMDAKQRAIVLHAIDEVCRHKEWSLLAIHVRTTHVHIVVRSAETPEFVMNTFKSYASRALNLQAPTHKSRFRWARHGSVKHLWSQQFMDAAIRYVLTKQGEPMAHLSAP